MPCPHSTAINATPETCSQCLGAVPRVVRRGERLDVLMIDEVTAERPFILPSKTYSGAKNATSTLKGDERRCSLCGKFDHTRANCGVKNV